MKRMAVFLLIVVLLSGCKGQKRELEQVLALRQQILSATKCQFEAQISADYGEKLYSFSTQCQVDSSGELQFTVTEPESIAGITGRIADSGGNLTFDDVALSFPLLAEEELSPVSATWIFIKTLRSGYLTSVGREDTGLRVTIDDSYQEGALQVDIWLEEGYKPVRADILHDGSRILSLTIRNFQIL